MAPGNQSTLGFNMTTVKTLRVMAKRIEENEKEVKSAVKRLEDSFEENKIGLGEFEKKISSMISMLNELEREVLERSTYTREKAETTATRIQQILIEHT